MVRTRYAARPRRQMSRVHSRLVTTPSGAADAGILDPLATVPTRPDGSAVLLPEASPGPIAVGSVLRERFELIALLGRGGMGAVYKARDLRRAVPGGEDSYVALKIVGPGPSAPTAVRALVREFRDLRALSHPNIVNVFDIDEAGETCFYTMELLDGRRLSEEVGRGSGLLPRRYALSIVRQIGSALAYAHSHGVVHGDLKPSNVMLTVAGDVRVMDFGGVIPPEPAIPGSPHGERLSLATPAYASCEQLEGWPPDPRDDVYALACIAYLLLTGRHPFEQCSALQARARRLRPRRPPGLAAPAWRALRQGLAWSRAQRPRDVGTWVRRLAPDGMPGALLPLTRFRAGEPHRVRARHPLAAAALLLAAGLGAFAVLRQDELEPRRLRAALDGALEAGLQAWRPLAAAPAAPAGPSAASAARAPRVLPGVAFSASTYVVPDSEPAARIIIRRTGPSDGEVSFLWWTEQSSAKPDEDYVSVGRRAGYIPRGQEQITLYIPIISDPLRPRTTQFQVAVASPGDDAAGAARATVTIERGLRPGGLHAALLTYGRRHGDGVAGAPDG